MNKLAAERCVRFIGVSNAASHMLLCRPANPLEFLGQYLLEAHKQQAMSSK